MNYASFCIFLFILIKVYFSNLPRACVLCTKLCKNILYHKIYFSKFVLFFKWITIILINSAGCKLWSGCKLIIYKSLFTHVRFILKLNWFLTNVISLCYYFLHTCCSKSNKTHSLTYQIFNSWLNTGIK